MKAQPTTKQLIEMLYERLPELFDRAAAQPAPTVQEPYGYVSTHTSGLMHFNKTFQGVYTDTATEIVAVYTTPPAQPAVPDAFGTREGEHPQYIQGWNDCRAEMLKARSNT
jgi:hypothetical protein